MKLRLVLDVWFLHKSDRPRHDLYGIWDLFIDDGTYNYGTMTDVFKAIRFAITNGYSNLPRAGGHIPPRTGEG